ncbi:MAG: response regulator [Planctomycetes bacterium]|nr:response regulator [Planctomycetota bacterium]
MKKILVVDDDIAILGVLDRLLSKKGYKIISASDGATALVKVMEQSPDLVILDYKMTLVGGLEVLRKTKAFNGKIKIIMLTGFATEGLEKSARDFGADGFLEKGIPTDSLVKSIEAML